MESIRWRKENTAGGKEEKIHSRKKQRGKYIKRHRRKIIHKFQK